MTVTDDRTPSPALAELASRVRGRVLAPTDPDFDAVATPWNVAATSPPQVVVQVADAQDVSAALRFAAAHGLEVAVQLTGHGAVVRERPTLLVQTGLLDELEVRPDGTARVGAGVRWQRVLDAAGPRGLAGLAGSAPGVGVVGYLTGGGLSPLARTFGYASDLVTAFDVVTGDGEVRRATATENPALFWGLRGGKGALGIVTAVEFALVPLGTLLGGCLFFDGADAAAVAHAWRDWAVGLPEEATTSMAVMRLPAMPGVPAPLAGRTTVAVRYAWTGRPEEGRRVLAPLAAAAPVLFGGVDVMPVQALGAIHADPVDPMPVHDRGRLLRELPHEAVDALLDLAGPHAQCPQISVELRLLGGALARTPAVPSAVGHRDAAFSLITIGPAVPPVADAVVAHADRVVAVVDRWSDGAGQPNLSVSSDPAVVARNYEPAAFDRLSSLAATYDPHAVLAAARPFRRS